ncbi:hypothetical protein DPMN_165581 [Dreissena polymorpha]|uniref:Uncharacterized protein n=1 Tax=Dreissena polymorpha TaxID=45954 RepID=A0A9D4F0X5_DREPO|nr:hypothetical protein DPMN_165581 [Dreissena polymorpha]
MRSPYTVFSDGEVYFMRRRANGENGNNSTEEQFNPISAEGEPANRTSPGVTDTEMETVSEASDTDYTHGPVGKSKQQPRSKSSRDLWKAVNTLQSCIQDLAAEVKVVKGVPLEASANRQSSCCSNRESTSLQQSGPSAQA